jgi:hypothetical protein
MNRTGTQPGCFPDAHRYRGGGHLVCDEGSFGLTLCSCSAGSGTLSACGSFDESPLHRGSGPTQVRARVSGVERRRRAECSQPGADMSDHRRRLGHGTTVCTAPHVRGFRCIVLETEPSPESDPCRLRRVDGTIVEFTSVEGPDVIAPHVRKLRRVRGVVARHRRRSRTRCYASTMFIEVPAIRHLVARFGGWHDRSSGSSSSALA